MRAIWSGALSFGLVNIPIRIYPGTEEHALDFDMLHKKDLSPIRYARICKLEGKEIPYPEIVKGFEYSKGEYVVVDEEDFKKANVRKTKTIDIQCFVAMSQIDPIYYDKPYYIEPDKKAAKAFALLKEVLMKSKKVAVANYVFRNREHIGILRPYKNTLILNQLRYHAELREVEKLFVPEKEKFSTKEVEMALKLVDQLTETFKAEKYKDTYIEELATTIEEKLEGKKPARKAKEPSYKAAGDLMSLLKESLEKSIKEESPTATKKHFHHPKTTEKKASKPRKRKRS